MHTCICTRRNDSGRYTKWYEYTGLRMNCVVKSCAYTKMKLNEMKHKTKHKTFITENTITNINKCKYYSQLSSTEQNIVALLVDVVVIFLLLLLSFFPDVSKQAVLKSFCVILLKIRTEHLMNVYLFPLHKIFTLNYKIWQTTK